MSAKLVGKPGAGKPHAGFDAAGAGNRVGQDIEALSTERGSNGLGRPKPLHQVSTLQAAKGVQGCLGAASRLDQNSLPNRGFGFYTV